MRWWHGYGSHSILHHESKTLFAKPIAAVALCATFAVPALALPPQATELTTDSAFVGLSFDLGGGFTPRFGIGWRQTTVQPNGDMTGGELRLTFDPQSPRDVQLRAIGFQGTVNHAGAVGGGWDFGTGKPFVSGGVIFPYLSGIVDFGLGGGQPSLSIGLDSAGKAEAPATVPLFAPCGAPDFPGTVVTAC